MPRFNFKLLCTIMCCCILCICSLVNLHQWMFNYLFKTVVHQFQSKILYRFQFILLSVWIVYGWLFAFNNKALLIYHNTNHIKPPFSPNLIDHINTQHTKINIKNGIHFTWNLIILLKIHSFIIFIPQFSWNFNVHFNNINYHNTQYFHLIWIWIILRID